jgi:protease PrsW
VQCARYVGATLGPEVGDVGSQISVIALFAVLPFLALLRYYYRSDLFREPRGRLARTFALGAAVTIPALLVELGLGAVPVHALGPAAAAAYTAFVVAAIPEEALKLLVIGRYSARLRDFNEPMDGIVYGAMAGLGFAAVENAFAILGGGLLAAIMRSVTAVPLHATCGAVLGYYVARGRLERRRGSIAKGLAIAVLIHGLYDFGPLLYMELGVRGSRLANEGPVVIGLVALFFVVLLASWFGVRRLIRRLHAEQLRAASRAGRLSGPDGAPGASPVALPSVAGVADDGPNTTSGEGAAGEPPPDGTAGSEPS